jgi:hypothetical protein
VADKEYGAAIRGNLADSTQAFALERDVADSQYLVHEEDLGLKMSSYGKSQSHVHTRGVMLHRRVNELFNFREGHDAIELAVDVLGSHAQNCAVQIDILAPCQFSVKTCTDFQERTNPPIQVCHTGGWLRNAGENLEESALAGAVSTNDAHNFARLNLKRDILESPNVSIFVGGIRSSASENAKWFRNSSRNGISQGTVGLLFGANGIPFGNSLGLYRNATH